jgi:hypothetical protein
VDEIKIADCIVMSREAAWSSRQKKKQQNVAGLGFVFQKDRILTKKNFVSIVSRDVSRSSVEF